MILVVLLVALAVLASVTTVERAPTDSNQHDRWAKLRDVFPGVNLGLDLQGGLRLVYEVEVEAAVEDKRNHIAQGIVQELDNKARIKGVTTTLSRDVNTEFALQFPNAESVRSKNAREVLTSFRGAAVVESEDGATINMRLVDELVADTQEMAVKQAVETIGNRIDELGLVNTSVSPRDQDVIVEIPGVDERQVSRIKRIISQTARLELKIVDEPGSVSFFQSEPIAEKIRKEREEDGAVRLKVDGAGQYYLEAQNEHKGASGRQILRKFLAGIELPENREISFEEERARDAAGNPTADITCRTYFTYRTAGITGEYIEQSTVQFDENQKPYVSMSFTREGAGIFADLTEANVQRRMAIILDGRVKSAPVIQEKIGGGQARITLGMADSFKTLMDEATDLVVVLNAGALPAPIRPVTEATIGPQLGDDGIAKGQHAFLIAIVIILVFMVVYYRKTGIAADIALLCNALFIMAILSGAGATLTLPGIAGIIVTFGMAVDANVLINERIREELRTGKAPRAAVEAGYGRAFVTILDSQITTFIAGVVLLQFGTGAIKGFAVTLLIGIVTSMFTAIIISRLVVDFMLRKRADQLSI